MVRRPGWVGMAVLAWVRTQTPQELDRLAREQADVVDDLAGRYTPYLPLARTLLGPAGTAAVAGMSDVDYEGLLDLVLQEDPERGLVLWRHKPWFLDQLRRARHRFLSL